MNHYCFLGKQWNCGLCKKIGQIVKHNRVQQLANGLLPETCALNVDIMLICYESHASLSCQSIRSLGNRCSYVFIESFPLFIVFFFCSFFFPKTDLNFSCSFLDSYGLMISYVRQHPRISSLSCLTLCAICSRAVFSQAYVPSCNSLEVPINNWNCSKDFLFCQSIYAWRHMYKRLMWRGIKSWYVVLKKQKDVEITFFYFFFTD